MIDTDKQGTLSRWHERREAATPKLAQVPFSRIREALGEMRTAGAQVCFIDTAPSINEQTAGLVDLADLCVIPVRPSPNDLWSVAETVNLVKQGHRHFLFVVTQAKSQALITNQAASALSRYGRVASTIISDRIAYASAMTGGITAPEIGNHKAAEEVARLWLEVKSCFHQRMKSPKPITEVQPNA
jgi:chromosome partitioning protein